MKRAPDAIIPRRILLWFAKRYERLPLCFYCGEKLIFTNEPVPNQATKDHIVPRAQGGKNGKFNTVRACWNCNNKKRSEHLSNMRMKLTGKRDGKFWGEIQFDEREKSAN